MCGTRVSIAQVPGTSSKKFLAVFHSLTYLVVFFRRDVVVLPLREEQSQFSSQLPGRGASWCYHVVKTLDLRTHWLVAELEQPTKAATDRYGPLLTRRRQPVRGDNW